MYPPYIPISNLLFQSTFDLLLSILQIKIFGVMRKLVSKVMSTHASVLVDSVGPLSAEVCRAAASFP
jgi:hypothetical protein